MHWPVGALLPSKKGKEEEKWNWEETEPCSVTRSDKASLTLGVKDQEADGGHGAVAPGSLNMTGLCKCPSPPVMDRKPRMTRRFTGVEWLGTDVWEMRNPEGALWRQDET